MLIKWNLLESTHADGHPRIGSAGVCARAARHRASGRHTLHACSQDSAWRHGAIGGLVFWCLLLTPVVFGGCSNRTELDASYGQRRGAGAASVNGTSVLASMFELKGCQVYSWNRLSPKLNAYQVIVWIPDSFDTPGDPQRQFLEHWLASGENRTLVYVGRDYDAATQYWRALVPMVTAQERIDVLRRQALARARHAARRVNVPAEAVCEWFALQRDAGYHQARHLAGAWMRDVVQEQTDLWVQTALQVPTAAQLNELWGADVPSIAREPDYEVLLSDGLTPLVTQVTKPMWNGGQILTVSNGSFLLNYPLVNHEHRKLAGRLIRACGEPGKVAFLESGPSGPPVFNREPGQLPKQGTRARVLMALHWLVLGLAFCFSVFPIFGRARAPASGRVAEFSQHIEALGALLQRTADEEFARRQVGHYRAVAQRESGAQHMQDPAERGQSVGKE